MRSIELPFFTSEGDSIYKAKDKITARYYDQTWIFTKADIGNAFGIPADSQKFFLIVLNAQGKIVTRVERDPTEQRAHDLQSADQSIT